jgi:short-subunit dehydrogenase
MAREGIAGKVIVITGASSGFGKGTALALAAEGASLVLAARRDELLDELVRECEAAGATALAVPTDVGRRGDMEELAQAALTRFGRFDVWINNAGVGAIGRFEAIPLEEHEQVIATDLLGTLYGSYLAYRQFLAQGAGTLINMSSELGKHSVPYFTSYTAAKHGVVGLCESLRQEIDQNGIAGVHVCLVMPTAHDTPFFDHAANYTGHETTPPKPLHDPQNVIDALVGLVRNPKDQKIVGADGIAKILMKSLAPGAEEKLVAKMMHKTTMEKAPPGPETAGAVRQPSARGSGIRSDRTEQRRH